MARLGRRRRPQPLISAGAATPAGVTATYTTVVDATAGVTATYTAVVDAAALTIAAAAATIDTTTVAAAAATSAIDATSTATATAAAIVDAPAAVAAAIAASWEAAAQAAGLATSVIDSSQPITAVTAAGWEAQSIAAKTDAGVIDAAGGIAGQAATTWEAGGQTTSATSTMIDTVASVGVTLDGAIDAQTGIAAQTVAAWDAIAAIAATAMTVYETRTAEIAGQTGDLCTLDEVRQRRQTKPDDLTQDPVVARVISSVSAAITRELRREFTPTTAAARVFELRPDASRIVLTPYELRTVTQVVANVDTDEPTTLDPADYRLAPHPAIHDTYHLLRLRPAAITPSADAWDRTLVEITGDWGFAAIPPEVREAAIVTVVHNMRTTVGQYSISDGAGGETRYERTEIPQAARELLKPYDRQMHYF